MNEIINKFLLVGDNQDLFIQHEDLLLDIKKE